MLYSDLDIVESDQNFRQGDMQELLTTNPHDYKRCKLVLQQHNYGHAIPFDEPTLPIIINGRDNLCRAFPGETVCVKILSREEDMRTGRVVGVMDRGETLPSFICKMVEGDPSLMSPIRKAMTRIRVLRPKKKIKTLNSVETCELDQGQWVRKEVLEANPTDLFLVNVLKWEDKSYYPLGVVTQVLPLDGKGLKAALDTEYGLKERPPSFKPEETKTDSTKREDFCDCLTFTIDPSGAEDLDDAISVTDQGETFQIAVHVTDVASLVPKDSEVDQFARNQGETFYKDKPAYMIDQDLSYNYLSLRYGQRRNAISLVVSVNKQTNEIVESPFALSHIKSDYKLSYQDAEKIIQGHLSRETEPLRFSSVEDCVIVAYRFSEMHRKARLAGGMSRVQHNNDRSHHMVEELMNMYNSAVADYLIASPLTRDLTPLRCHGPPDPDRLLVFKQKHQALIPLSPFLSQAIPTEESYHEMCTGNLEEPEETIDDDEEEDYQDAREDQDASEEDSVESHQGENDESDQKHSDESDQEDLVHSASFDTKSHPSLPEEFEVFNAVLKNLETATENRDHLTLVQLMASDDIHPTLIPMVRDFREMLSPAIMLRSCSTLKSRMGHFDLQLDSYTRASAPMRRYFDIILQRLLHYVLHGETRDASYTQAEIDQLCAMNDCDQASEYILDEQMLTQLNKQHEVHMAVVDKLDPNGHDFWICFPLKPLLEDLSIMYRHLKVVDQPKYNELRHTITLHWKKRVYSFTNTEKNPAKTLGSKYSTCIAMGTWQKMMSAVQNQNWDETAQCLQDIRSVPVDVEREGNDDETDKLHFKQFTLELRLGKVLPVQIGMGPGRTPEVHLMNISPEFEVCLEHSKRPTTCFSKLALSPSKSEYEDYKEYQEVWGRLCKMDTAHNALEENNSIILEGVELTWTVKKDDLKGYFRVSQTQKKQWKLEFDLTNCFLCIRLRDQHADEETEGSNGETLKDLPLPDPLPFTWVAHGVASRPKKKKKDDPKPPYIQVNFYINHHSMNYTPPQVFFKHTQFTVEVIPKKIPYVLREHAVTKLKRANQLVKSIAVGNSTIHSSNVKSVAATSSKTLATEGKKLGLPTLNTSQEDAVKQALQRQFTVIQGPPGTGKTVVGIHIVFQFFRKNQQVDRSTSASTFKLNKDTSKSPPKKRAILYCGPSNKSVDIVAEQLLKLHRKGVLKPMRVYSEQMETLEFPYPGSELKLCKQSLRDEKPKGELRPISLVHQIRETSNPFSEEIKTFDENIKKGLLMESDLERYKDIQKQAKLHELRKQDVILCTCAAALNPNFIEAMDFRQILIDECAMATEPEAFMPLVSHKPEQIVLLGDHKQLRPIVECAAVKEMGMKRSLLERYMEKALMLDTQYRMHEAICAFPSAMFYEGRLKTGAKREQCYLLKENLKATAIVFGHIQATEDSLIVSTTTGNENSKANLEEAAQAVQVARLLIEDSKVLPENIAILTPYNAQVSQINKKLKESDIENVTVCTISKSQGSEWPYVILSTVRSCKPSELQARPSYSKAWQGKHLGFITDPNQVNVAITRAQDGLCILGNRDLLRCNELWADLLAHYEEKGCVVDPAKNIKVLQRPSQHQR
ncbi:helicase with zinc finger domain 2-like [Clupea harengus]|uniref:Helicase with zinc finger domain 2-like n=1 Tax=Clupea harengus TaxID=7950 RepID=A0A8M1KNE9_CLUHA|nr:helicase with zinc finger domain 2-like [Clupea harengus]